MVQNGNLVYSVYPSPNNPQVIWQTFTTDYANYGSGFRVTDDGHAGIVRHDGSSPWFVP
jgi:hypothetical protein